MKTLRVVLAVVAALVLTDWGLCEWSFRRGAEYQRREEAAKWDGFMMDAWGFRPPPPHK